MKIVTVCALGYGTSVLLKVNAESALATLGIDAKVEAVDLDRAPDSMRRADLVLTTAAIRAQLGNPPAPVITIDNLIDLDEIRDKLAAALRPRHGNHPPYA